MDFTISKTLSDMNRWWRFQHISSSLYYQLGDANLNLTSLYDMVTRMFNRQTSLEAELLKTKEKLEETERKLNKTVEKTENR